MTYIEFFQQSPGENPPTEVLSIGRFAVQPTLVDDLIEQLAAVRALDGD